jgi:hypothetical protein
MHLECTAINVAKGEWTFEELVQFEINDWTEIGQSKIPLISYWIWVVERKPLPGRVTVIII